MVENSRVFLICLTCTIAALRLTDLTLFLIKWIRHNMSNHEEVQSWCRVSMFHHSLSLLAYDCHCGWQITVTRRHGCFFKVAWYCFLCLKLIVCTAIEVSRREASFNHMPETETESYMAFVRVSDEHACMHLCMLHHGCMILSLYFHLIPN